MVRYFPWINGGTEWYRNMYTQIPSGLMHDGGWWCRSGVGGAASYQVPLKAQQPPLQKMPWRNVQMHAGISGPLIVFCPTNERFLGLFKRLIKKVLYKPYNISLKNTAYNYIRVLPYAYFFFLLKCAGFKYNHQIYKVKNI